MDECEANLHLHLHRADTDAADAADAADAGAGAVLTGYPLGYRMRSLPMKDDEGINTVGYLPAYGVEEEDEEEEEEAIDSETTAAATVAAVAVHSFGERLCYPAALRLRVRPAAPREPSSSEPPDLSSRSSPPPTPTPPTPTHIPALLPNPSFLFARSVALIRDCPSDPHAPFLYLGEELSLGARLWTRGWDLFLPNRCPLRVCYDPRHRASELDEDRRSGRLLYADHRESGRGPPDEVAQRVFLNLQSQRRVLHLIGCPDRDDDDDDVDEDEDAVVLDGPWGLGETRPVREFLEHLGVDFEEREVSVRARSAGLPTGAACWNYNNNNNNNVAAAAGSNGNRKNSKEAKEEEEEEEEEGKRSDGMNSRIEEFEWGAGVVARDGLPLRWRVASGAIDNHLAVGPIESVGGA